MGTARLALVLCSLAGSFGCDWGYSGCLLVLLVRLSLAILAYLSSLTVWFLVDVATDGVAALDKIHRSMDLLIAGSKLGFSFSSNGQSSSTGGLLLLVGVTLCLPHAISVALLPSSYQVSSVAQLEQLGLPWHGRMTDKTRGAYLCRAPLSVGFSWHVLKYNVFVSSGYGGLCYPSVPFS